MSFLSWVINCKTNIWHWMHIYKVSAKRVYDIFVQRLYDGWSSGHYRIYTSLLSFKCNPNAELFEDISLLQIHL